MRPTRVLSGGGAALLAACLLAACGGSSSSTPSTSSSQGAAGAGTSTAAAAGGGSNALSAEAQAAATGDIPDSQVFLTFHDPGAGYSLVYPEGWAQKGSGNDVTFRDKNNVVHVSIAHGAPPSSATVVAALSKQRASLPSLQVGAPSSVTINGAPVTKVSYTTLSAPNPVTGKRVQLIVDRYVYAHAGKVATVDLGTAKGVDNIDAYKRMARSFKWS